MKKDKLRLFPMFIMLIAGLFTTIITYYFQYEIKASLLILLCVLLLFYIFGLIFVGVIHKFDDINQVEREAKAEDEEEALLVERKNTDNSDGAITAETEGA